MAERLDPRALGTQLAGLHTEAVRASGGWSAPRHARFVAEHREIEAQLPSIPEKHHDAFLEAYGANVRGIDDFPALFARSAAIARATPIDIPRYARLDHGPVILPVTDMDGTLLGSSRSEYDYDAAKPTLRALEREGIPVVLNSSKTFAELHDHREQMGNGHPFIVENGAKIFIPEGYFSKQPAGTVRAHGYWVLNLGGRTRAELLGGLASARLQGLGPFTHFAAAGAAGISVLTHGLTLDESARANMRMGSESALWGGTPQGKADFVAHLADCEIEVVEGGKFTTLTGKGTKGKALTWLSTLYAEEWGRPIAPVALGDGGNDLSALEAAQAMGGTAVVIAPIDPRKRPLHQTPEGRDLRTSEQFLYLEAPPAEAWAEALRRIMAEAGVSLS